MMQCKRCNKIIEADDGRQWQSQLVCEDCYIDVMAPAPGKDHWEVLTDEHRKPDPSA